MCCSNGPLSLAVESTGGLGPAQRELGGGEEGIAALAVPVPPGLGAGAVVAADGVAGGLAEGEAEVAAGGKQLPQVVQTDRLLAADAVPVRVTNTAENPSEEYPHRTGYHLVCPRTTQLALQAASPMVQRKPADARRVAVSRRARRGSSGMAGLRTALTASSKH